MPFEQETSTRPSHQKSTFEAGFVGLVSNLMQDERKKTSFSLQGKGREGDE